MVKRTKREVSFGISDVERDREAKAYRDLKDKLAGQYNRLYTLDDKRYNGYWTFEARYTKALVDFMGRHLTGYEWIMLANGGPTVFAASCSVDEDKMLVTGHIDRD